ncbi:MAG TPA: hypothetical protein VFA60_05695 [Terriglobales bacterium]|nr:hypothetical protein [Terriglobales bacterium]
MNDGKIMFEIYRDALEGTYRVVYYTELDDHTKDWEISRAAAGDSVFDGFLSWSSRLDGKRAIAQIVDAFNSGAPLDAAELRKRLAPFLT